MLSRVGVKGNRKLILVLIQERTLLLVSGCIESSAFSLSLSSCSFSLAFSLVLLPSFFLSLLLVLAFLPSLRCNTFVGQMHSEQNQPIQPLPCIFVLSWDLIRICIRANYLSLVQDLPSSNMLEAAISGSALQPFPRSNPSFRPAVLAEARIRPGVAWWVDYFPSASGVLPPRLSLPSGRLGSSPGAWGAP